MLNFERRCGISVAAAAVNVLNLFWWRFQCCWCLINVYLFVLVTINNVDAINNHWVVKDSKIIQKFDSPFYMREPDNLVAFLQQIRYNQYVERSYRNLMRKRDKIIDHLRFSMRFGEELVEQAKCAMDFYMLEKRMSYLKLNSEHLKRINLPDLIKAITKPSTAANKHNELGDMKEPICESVYDLKSGPKTFDNLDSFKSPTYVPNEVEHELDNTDAPTLEIIKRYAIAGLLNEPSNWKFHTLSSYYWRLLGNAGQALPCARLAVMLAPSKHKDIALLSLGTILFRMGNLPDADIVLSAAVAHGPRVAQNHLVLGSALAMRHDFNRSLHHFDEAERLDPSTTPRTKQVRNFINCLQNLTKKTSKIYGYVEYMKKQVREFKKLKYQLIKNHERLLQLQLPLTARYLDSDMPREELQRRGQYCTTRIPMGSKEPVLYCDFYSDIQMRLESKDVDIDIDELERDLKENTDAVIRRVSTEISKQLNLHKRNQAKVVTAAMKQKKGANKKKKKKI